MSALELPTHVWSELDASEQQSLLLRPALQERETLKSATGRIINEVRQGKDDALFLLTARYDGVQLTSLAVPQADIEEAPSRIGQDAHEALKQAKAHIECFHRAQVRKNIRLETGPGIVCERICRAIERVGLYVPGGSAPLPSTVLMLALPATIAGCQTRILCTPPGADGRVDPHILASAKLAGITQVFCVGGAQAIAAMAFGTETIPKVDKVFGPGNAWVTEAKSQVSLDPDGAASDMPAGPSELLVVADDDATSDFVAADLLSQAEHGVDSQVVLLSDSPRVLKEVAQKLEAQLENLSRKSIARESLKKSRLILADNLTQAMDISNRYAPEHLSLQVREPRRLLDRVRNAGSVFLGPWSPEAVGDYASGTNHVLPTYGYARTYSGLGVQDFEKSITVQELSEGGLKHIGPAVERLASIEGLDAHKNAVTVRLKKCAEERSS